LRHRGPGLAKPVGCHRRNSRCRWREICLKKQIYNFYLRIIIICNMIFSNR
jgi:hypothetical protein